MEIRCENCKYFNEYYVKGIGAFFKTRCGRCYKTGQTVKNSGSCDNWRESQNAPTTKEELLKRVNLLVTSLIATEQILREKLE